MTLTSLTFYIFLPICITAYFLIPGKFRYIWLLFCSYFFYCSLDGAFVSLLIASTIITWISGGLVYRASSQAAKKCIVSAGTILNVSLLLVFKYANFFLSVAGSEKSFSLLLPIGISFYTFQSLTYIFDIYKGDVKPERNIFRYALFVSFFPLILSGPIERAKRLIPQLSDRIQEVRFDTIRAKEGLMLMLAGYFMKIVIVARLTILTDFVFSDYLNKSGFALFIATLAYTFQIYCDFAGYSLIAIGMCKIMGIEINANFRQPYFAVSVADFWRRWHISLSTWFRDYLYIPLGGNRKGRIRKYINIMIVFIVSGLWHGANMTFVFWGFLNGIYQVIGDLLKPLKERLVAALKLEKRPRLLNGIQVFITFVLISFTWIFFRSRTVAEAFTIIERITSSFSLTGLMDGTIWNVGLGIRNMLFVLVALAVLIISDILCEKKNCAVTDLMVNVKTPLRFAIYYALVIMILLSMNLNMTEFIYSGF